MQYTKVTSVEQLFELVAEGHKNYFVKFGFARSSKYIEKGQHEGELEVVNLIDGTTQVLTAETIMDEYETNIGKAIYAGAFWLED